MVYSENYDVGIPFSPTHGKNCLQQQTEVKQNLYLMRTYYISVSLVAKLIFNIW